MNALVQTGADPNQIDKNGDSPIALAWRGYPLSGSSHEAVSRFWGQLLRRETSAQERYEDGDTPLHVAASCGAILFAQLLLMYGADLECRDAQGRTPLHRAAQSGRRAMAKYLVNAEADESAICLSGLTPFQLAPAGYDADREDALPRRRAAIAAVQGYSEQNGLEGDEDDGEEGDLPYLDSDQDWNRPIVGGGFINGMWREHGIETGAKWNGGSDDE